jgi:hypothetical protein
MPVDDLIAAKLDGLREQVLAPSNAITAGISPGFERRVPAPFAGSVRVRG